MNNANQELKISSLTSVRDDKLCIINITHRQEYAKTILFLPRWVQSFSNRRRKESNHTVKDSATVFDLTESLSSRAEVRDLREERNKKARPASLCCILLLIRIIRYSLSVYCSSPPPISHTSSTSGCYQGSIR